MARFVGEFALPQPQKNEHRMWCKCSAVYITTKEDWDRELDSEGYAKYRWKCPNCGLTYTLYTNGYQPSYFEAFNCYPNTPM